MAGEVTLWLAFSAGILSFLSPCVLPLYPSFLSYITGVSVSDLKEANRGQVRRKVVLHSVFFVIGVSLIYIILGLGTSFIGDFFQQYKDLIRQLGAILIIAMGLFLVGWLKLGFMNREKRLTLKNKPAGYFGSLLIGFVFAAGWTPCIGPILGAIIFMGASNPELALPYTLLYSLGFAIPFIALGFFIGSTRAILKYSGILMKIGGVVMIILGILLFTDQLNRITIFLNNIFGASWF